MKLCCERCKPMCDFCKWYDDYGNRKDVGEFLGLGICMMKDVEKWCESGSDCEEFECLNYKEKI